LTPANLHFSFDNVMGAIGSNNARWGITDVTLELQQGAAPAPTSTTPPPLAAAPKPTASSTLVEVKIAAVDGKTTNILVNGSNVGQPLRALMQAEKLGVYEAGWSSMMNCGGAGQCGMCIVGITAGDALLSERTDAEARHLTKKGKPANWRLACQTCVNDGATGAVEVQAQPQAKK
jgi:ferredoxin